MPGPYSFATDRVTGGPSPAADVNALGAAFNEAASAATPNVLMLRDANGRAKVGTPAAADDAATKDYVDDAVAGVSGGGGGTSKLWTYPETSGRVRVGAMTKPNSDWVYVEADYIYFYPVPYFDGGVFGVQALGFSLRGSAAGATARGALYNSQSNGFPGAPVAQSSASMDSTGWKNLTITPVNDLPEGWYWHAFQATGRADVHGGFPLGMFDAASMENAVRDDQYMWRGLLSTTTHASMVTNPAVQTWGGTFPIIGVRFV